MSKTWSRPTRYLVLILILIIGGWFLYQSKDLLGPLAISALLAFILNPAVSFVHERAKLARSIVVLLVYFVSLIVIVITGFVIVQIISQQTASLLMQLQDIITQIESSYFSNPIRFFNFEFQPLSIIPESTEISTDFIQADFIVQIAQSTTTNLGWILVVIITTYYLLLDWARLRDWFFKWAPEGYENDGRRIYDEVTRVWRRYFRGQLRLSLIVGFFTALGALIIGLPGAVLFGILAAVFDVLLSVGPAIVLAIATAVGLLAGSNLLDISNVLFAILVMAVFGLIQIIENIWLRPRILSNTLKIHPAIIFIAIIASLALAGVLIALVIVPVIASVGILAKYIYFKLFEMDPWENW